MLPGCSQGVMVAHITGANQLPSQLYQRNERTHRCLSQRGFSSLVGFSGDIHYTLATRQEIGAALTPEDAGMRAVIVGAGMGGLMAALVLRQSGVFASSAVGILVCSTP